MSDNNSLEIKIEGNAKSYKQALEDAKSRAKKLSDDAAKAVEEANKKAQEAIGATDKKTKKAAESAAKEAKRVANNAIAEARRAAKDVAKANQDYMNNQADLVGGVNKVAKGLAATAVAVGGAVLGTGVAFNSQIEQYQAGFKTMLGSAEKADETLGKLREFASVTPFELTDLANASTTLLAFGEDVNNLMPDLKMLGDISLGNKEKFNSLALVFGQVQSQGRLMGQDLLQMINSGFNPLKVISEQTGESMTSLKDKMAKGQISFEMVAEAMKIATSEGGQFFNAMDEQSKTLKGQFSTLTDNVKDFAGSVSEDLSGHLTNKVLPALIDKVETLHEMWEDGSLEKWLGGAAAAATTFGVAVAGMNIALLIKDLRNIKQGVEAYTAVTKLGTIAQKGFNAAQAATPWGVALTLVGMLVGSIAAYNLVVDDATDSTKELAEKIENTRKEYDESIKSIDKTTDEQIAETKVVDTLKDKLYELEDQLNSNTLSEELAKKKREEFNTVANELNNIIPGIIDNIGTETNQFALQRGEIDKLITSYKELSIAKAYANAYQEKMNEAAKKAVEAEQNVLDAEKNYQEVWSAAVNKVKRDKDEREAIWGKHPAGKYNINKEAAKRLDVKEAFGTLETAQDELQEYNDELNKYSNLYTEKMKKLGEQTQDTATETGDVVSKVATATTDTTKKENEKKKSNISQSQKAILDLIENCHKLGIISDKDYYDALSGIRDEYFEEGSEEWQKYTDDIEKYYSDTLKNLKDKMESFSKKLQDDTHKTYSTITLSADGETKTWTTLADMDYQNKKLEEYYNLLTAVKEKRGEIPKDALANLQEMETDQAIAFLQTMLKASDTEWDNWVSGIEENKELADKLSQELYADELDENEKFIQAFKDQWGELPEDFFKIGEDCAEQYGEGLKAIKGILEEARASVMSMFSTVPVANVISTGPGTGTGTSNTYNTDNRTTNIYASGQSPRAIIEASAQNEIYQAHTSTFGG